MKRLIILFLIIFALAGCKQEFVHPGTPDVSVRDGMVVILNTTTETIGSYLIEASKDEITYRVVGDVARIVPGDSLLYRLSRLQGIDSSKPVGERVVSFPADAKPDWVRISGSFAYDDMVFIANWPADQETE
jgi:hypothetical protein